MISYCVDVGMFCPNCGAGYVERISDCADSRIALVTDRPPEKEIESADFEKILTIFNVGDIAVIKYWSVSPREQTEKPDRGNS